MSVNRCIFIGNVGKDPEVKTVGENKVAVFSLAMTEKGYTTKSGASVPEKTEWVNIVAWRGLAEMCEKWVTKGTQLYVEGKLTTRNYENKDGQKVYVTEIVADTIRLLGSKPKEEKAEHDKYASEPNKSDDDCPF